FILLTSTASFKDRLFSKLYNKESAQALTNSSDFTAIKSTTYYNYPYGLDKINDFINDLKNDLPVIKSYGFNTLWFVPARENYYTPESGYKESAFSDLKEVLALLKQNNMKAILPLTYTVYYNYCSVLDNPVDYQAFVDYHKEFLTRISDFSDISYILVFTEAFWGCNGDNSYVTPAGGEKLSVKLKATVGKLPDDLPADLRSKFTFGYHDSFTPLGWNQGTPSMESGSYDFFSFGTYPKINTTEDTIKKDLQLQIDNIHQFFPDIPLFTGEVGAPFCSPSNEDEQSRLNSITTTFLLDKKIGINIWQWKPIFWREPDSNQRDCNFGGHAVTNPDGSPRKTLISLKQIFGPSDSPVPSPTPYPTPS
ncbi:MAG: hypothetical protein Q8O68_01145, partial [Candidatus Daviesbacteria bacterium]|nr:hypothetical protein [Candidatus Daviesbacteria bacterium]